MTEGEIWFNYHHAIAQAEALERVADRLKSGVQVDMERGLSDTAACWHGDNARHWQMKGQRLQESVEATARRLRSAAGEIRAAARRAREIELANLAIIQNQSTS